jgi:hypothetical protein
MDDWVMDEFARARLDGRHYDPDAVGGYTLGDWLDDDEGEDED